VRILGGQIIDNPSKVKRHDRAPIALELDAHQALALALAAAGFSPR
jgi:hypothetical protein